VGRLYADPGLGQQRAPQSHVAQERARVSSGSPHYRKQIRMGDQHTPGLQSSIVSALASCCAICQSTRLQLHVLCYVRPSRRRHKSMVAKPDEDLHAAVNDPTFFQYVERLKELHNFLYQEAVPIPESEVSSLQMGNLRALHYDKDGRPPTADEWNQVERQTQAIYIFLSPALRRKFLMTGTPSIVLWMPVYLLSIAVIAIVVPVATFNWGWLTTLILVFYLIWLGALGAVGALAYVGMNALSIQDDVTFDLSSVRLITLRVVLGALFAVVLTLPFGYSNFIDFCRYLATYNGTLPNDIFQKLTAQALSLLLPFVLGFSTPSVILILNQLVDAVQTFFGRKQGPADATFGRLSSEAFAKPNGDPQRMRAGGGQ